MEDIPDKRYLVFCYDHYYPNGGIFDMIDSFDTLPEAIKCRDGSDSDMKDIYDRIKGIMIE